MSRAEVRQTRGGQRGSSDTMRIGRRVLGGGILLLFAFCALWLVVVFVQVSISASQSQGRVADGDAIVVLGAAQYNGTPSPVLEARLDTAFTLWSDGAADQIVTTGSNQPGDTFTEGFAAFTRMRWFVIFRQQNALLVSIIE